MARSVQVTHRGACIRVSWQTPAAYASPWAQIFVPGSSPERRSASLHRPSGIESLRFFVLLPPDSSLPSPLPEFRALSQMHPTHATMGQCRRQAANWSSNCSRMKALTRNGWKISLRPLARRLQSAERRRTLPDQSFHLDCP